MLKLTRIAGYLACLGSAILLVVLKFFNPYTPEIVRSVPVTLMLMLALAGMAASLAAKPYWMLALAIISFIPIGLYLLGTPGIFRWVGVLNLLFLAAGLLMLFARRK